jgi:O-antigen ligase
LRPPALPWAALAAAALSFASVLYLALSDGGYDTVSRSQFGIAIWWIVLLAAAVGVLPIRLPPVARIALGLLLGFTLWTGLSATWSESPELSTDSLGMVTTYLGVFVLALTLQGRSVARHAVGGAAAAVGLVGLLAVLSRLHPGWFPANAQLVFFQSARRLSYPLNYWNGLAAFLAMGAPLLLSVAAGARRVAAQALAAAAIPVLLLAMYLTISRGGAIALGVALVVYLLITHDRIAALATMLVTGAGGAVLIAYADRRPILRAAVDTPAATHAGDRMIPVIILACAGVALLQAAIALAARHAHRSRWLEPSRRAGTARIGAVVLALLIVAVAVRVPGRLEHAWHDFKKPGLSTTTGSSSLFGRLQSAAGNDRYQYWQAAAKADDTKPLTGIGAGAFVLWWDRHDHITGVSVVDAHSLYMQTLAETGIIGLILIAGFVLCLLGAGVWRALRAPPHLRLPLAGATAGVAAFATCAAYDWVWQLGAISTLALMLGAVSLAGREPELRSAGGPRRPLRLLGRWDISARSLGLAGRAALAVTAVAALVAIALPLAEARDLQHSQAAVRRGDLSAALGDARAALRVQPYAESAQLQVALVLEQAGALSAARTAAVEAVSDERANWQPWVILSRIEAELGHGRLALGDFDHARSLDPESPIFS